MKTYKRINQNYTVVTNNILNAGVSLKAVGLYVYIISKPDGWDFSILGTASQLREGKDSIRAAARELEEAGYLRREQRKEGNKFAGNVWIVSDEPIEPSSPVADFPLTGNTATENPPQVSTKEVSTNQVSKEDTKVSDASVGTEEVVNVSTMVETEQLQPDTSKPDPSLNRDRWPVDMPALAPLDTGDVVRIGKSGRPALKPKKRPNAEVTEALKYFQSKTGLKVLDGSQRDNRIWAAASIKKLGGLAAVKYVIDCGVESKFWSAQLTSFLVILKNGVKIAKSSTVNRSGSTQL